MHLWISFGTGSTSRGYLWGVACLAVEAMSNPARNFSRELLWKHEKPEASSVAHLNKECVVVSCTWPCVAPQQFPSVVDWKLKRCRPSTYKDGTVAHIKSRICLFPNGFLPVPRSQRRPQSKAPGKLQRSWHAACQGWFKGRARTSLKTEESPSTLAVPVGGKNIRPATKAWVAANESKEDHRLTKKLTVGPRRDAVAARTPRSLANFAASGSNVRQARKRDDELAPCRTEMVVQPSAAAACGGQEHGHAESAKEQHAEE